MRRSRRPPPNVEASPRPPIEFACEGLARVSDGIVVMGADGRIVYTNRAADAAFGYGPGELVGRAAEVLGGGGAERASSYRHKNGTEIPLTPAVDDLSCPGEGGPFRVLIFRDLSEEARLREQLIQSEKMSAIGQLVAGVAHDLNNPLTSIIGYAQLLAGRNQDPGMRRGLEVVAAEAARAARIVQNLLTVARKHVPERRRLGLNGIVEKTLELKAHDFRVNRIEVVTDLDPDLPMTLLDFHQIQQVLLNLVINAEQAIRQERTEGTIRIGTRRGGLGIRLTVEDDGPGIPDAVIRRIFDPFFTTKPVGVGTGLGLSICHGILAEHGGTIGAENRPEGGARFVVELPIIASGPEAAAGGDPADAAGAVPAEAPGTAPGAAPGRPALSLLVVDDEAPIQDVLVAMLTMDGHRIDTASSGESALRKIERRGYDLILSDLRMPGMTGMEFYEHLSKRDRSLAERIVFMTGDLVNQESQSFLARTSNLTLSKPFTLEGLRETLRRFAERFPGDGGRAPLPTVDVPHPRR